MATLIDYAKLSLEDVQTGLDDVARDAQSSFGAFNGPQLNWRPDATRWSVAQCFEHLLTANQLMLDGARSALAGSDRRTVWQRLPVLPGVFGRALVRSQAPGKTRKFVAPSKARPTASHIAPDVIDRFVAQHRDLIAWMRALDERAAARAIMTSPFAKVITYSVLDAARLVFAHDRRHVEQARRVVQSPQFPN